MLPRGNLTFLGTLVLMRCALGAAMAWRVGRGDDLFCRKDVSYFYASESGIYFEDLMCPPVSLLARH